LIKKKKKEGKEGENMGKRWMAMISKDYSDSSLFL